MPSQADRIEFAPPPQRGQIRAFTLALLAHAVLVVGLTWGLHWKRTAEDSAVEAELWSSVVMQAAPKPVETPPPPPAPQPQAVVKETPPPPQVKDADIALERDRKKREQEKKDREAKELEKKQLAEKAAKEKKEKADKLAADKKKQELQDKRDDQLAKAAEEKRRQDNIRRSMGLAGATGAADATGNAQKSSGPSAGYGDRLAAVFKRNLTFANPESINGNPKAVVEVRVGPSGLIMTSRLLKSSGIPAWDEAALRAVQKTDRVPSDNGKYMPVFPVEFGPKD